MTSNEVQAIRLAIEEAIDAALRVMLDYHDQSVPKAMLFEHAKAAVQRKALARLGSIQVTG